jgi:murein DD-endopeptidase MepM/ murein hydrolase activator NlpD
MDYRNYISLFELVWLSWRKPFLLLLLLVAMFLTPTVSYAGFFSNLFPGPIVSAQEETVIEATSQTISLPEPAVNFDPSVIKVETEVIIDGGEALLPEVGPSTAAPEAVDSSNGQISVYMVRSGDTLAEIAEMFDVSINTILWANDLTRSSILKTGQTLVILPITGVMHTVVSGDTLNTIAKKYGGDVDEIASFNDLKIAAKLVVGDKILIPDGQVSSSLRPSSSGSRLVTSGGPDLGNYYIKPFIGGRRTQGLHGYNAVDYGLSIGSPLYAAAGGTVLISKNSGWNGGYGNYVVIQHPNKTQTVYGHMNYTVVSTGQIVGQGQLIGYSGNTGKSTGPHLHLEVRGARNPF